MLWSVHNTRKLYKQVAGVAGGKLVVFHLKTHKCTISLHSAITLIHVSIKDKLVGTQIKKNEHSDFFEALRTSTEIQTSYQKFVP